MGNLDSIDSDSIYKEINNDSKNLIVVFGGLAGELPIPVFEFLRSLQKYSCDKIFIRDLRQKWYQNGLQGYTENIYGTTELLRNLCGIKDYQTISFIGNSSGGYAALLFGNLLKVYSVIAFSPQTFINKRLRKKYDDNRWNKQIVSIFRLKSKKILDVKKILCSKKNITENHIYFSSKDNLDKIHAERLKYCNNVFLHQYDYSGHYLIRSLKNNGDLVNILDSHLIPQ